MKVLQTIPSMLAAWGGPSTCTCDLLEGFYDIDAQVDLLTSGSSQKADLILGQGRPWMKLVENDWKTPLAFSSNFKKSLINSAYDVYHVNTIWLYPSHVTCKIARQKHSPYVLSPHGMLYPTALKVSAWKKVPMKYLWFNKDIHKAACLHATCEQEMIHIREFGYKGPIAVIPNPVVFPEGVTIKEEVPKENKIGYLGRLHPIKKVENLLYGAAEVLKKGSRPFKIEIMGKGAPDYEKFLHDEVERLGLSEIVNFVGFVSGIDKYNRLANLRALFVPSAQENFGMIVPEALICGTPVYASLGTPWKELNEYQCGWWRDNDASSIADVIRNVLNMQDSEILLMGAKGRKLMEDKYEQHKVAQMMIDLYKWILQQGNKPAFVYE